MTRRKRTLIDAFKDLAVRFVDAVDADKLLHPPKPKEPVKLKAIVVDAKAEDVQNEVKP